MTTKLGFILFPKSLDDRYFTSQQKQCTNFDVIYAQRTCETRDSSWRDTRQSCPLSQEVASAMSWEWGGYHVV